MATNGVQWLHNIKAGISTADEALDDMLRCLKHCRQINDAVQGYSQQAREPLQGDWINGFLERERPFGATAIPTDGMTDKQLVCAIEAACAAKWGITLGGIKEADHG